MHSRNRRLFNRHYNFVRRKIERYIPIVKRRNKEALLWTGGEPCLLYIPNGVTDDAVWDDVRQTYLTRETTYELYLNRYVDVDGCRLYTDDTDRVPSILIAFPSTPDEISAREDGLQIINRMNAWTLWDPILPPKGCIIVRQIPGNQNEYYLLENVTHSWFPNLEKTQSHLLHQESPLTQLEDGVLVKFSDLPTVADTLALYKNDLEFDLDGLLVMGLADITDDGTIIRSGSSIRDNGSWLNNKIQVDVTPLDDGGVVYFSWSNWTDSTKPRIEINRNTNTVAILIDGNTIIRQTNFIMATNDTQNVRVEINNYVVKVWIGDDLVLSTNLKAHALYNSLQPLSPDYFEMGSIGIDTLFQNLYIMELI